MLDAEAGDNSYAAISFCFPYCISALKNVKSVLMNVKQRYWNTEVEWHFEQNNKGLAFPQHVAGLPFAACQEPKLSRSREESGGGLAGEWVGGRGGDESLFRGRPPGWAQS